MTGSEQLRTPGEDEQRAALIRQLNDQFRMRMTGGRVMVTQGAANLANAQLPFLLDRVSRFTAFDRGNDPYCEHDFGAFEWQGETVFWKIDYYDVDLSMGSPDPADPAVTTRVLTIMLAWEY